MDALDILIQQIEAKLQQLKEYIGEGKPETFEEYKRLCGEIKGLLIAKSYALDLKQRLELTDE